MFPFDRFIKRTPPVQPFHAIVSRGKAGRWRWSLRDMDGAYRAGGPPYGFDTPADAKADALAIAPGVNVYEEAADSDRYGGGETPEG